MKKYITLSIFLLAFFISTHAPVEAVESGEIILSGCPFYDTRNVVVSLAPENSASSLGAEVSFKGVIDNRNSFPVTDTSVYIYVTGPDGVLYDTFLATPEYVTLKPSSKTSFAFSWKVPAFALSGTYTARAYVYSHGEFYMGGVPFINDIFAGETLFTLKGENTDYIHFNASSVSVNKQKYSKDRGFLVPRKDPVSVSVKIDHNLKKAKQVVVIWKMYSLDSHNEKNLIESSIEKIDFVPGVSAVSNVVFKDMFAPEYEIVGEISFMDVKSLISTHVYRRGMTFSRFSFMGYSSSDELMVCIDSRMVKGDEVLFPKNVTLSLQDKKGKDIGSTSFIVERSPVSGFTKTLSGNYSKVNAVATLFDAQGREEDRVSMSFDSINKTPGQENIPYGAVVACFGGFVMAYLFYQLRKRHIKASALIMK